MTALTRKVEESQCRLISLECRPPFNFLSVSVVLGDQRRTLWPIPFAYTQVSERSSSRLGVVPANNRESTDIRSNFPDRTHSQVTGWSNLAMDNVTDRQRLEGVGDVDTMFPCP